MAHWRERRHVTVLLHQQGVSERRAALHPVCAEGAPWHEGSLAQFHRFQRTQMSPTQRQGAASPQLLEGVPALLPRLPFPRSLHHPSGRSAHICDKVVQGSIQPSSCALSDCGQAGSFRGGFPFICLCARGRTDRLSLDQLVAQQSAAHLHQALPHLQGTQGGTETAKHAVKFRCAFTSLGGYLCRLGQPMPPICSWHCYTCRARRVVL